MPRYLSQHTLACLPRQAVAEIVRRLARATEVKLLHVFVNMQEGKMFIEFEAPERGQLEKFLDAEKLYGDSLMRIEYECIEGEMTGV